MLAATSPPRPLTSFSTPWDPAFRQTWEYETIRISQINKQPRSSLRGVLAFTIASENPLAMASDVRVASWVVPIPMPCEESSPPFTIPNLPLGCVTLIWNKPPVRIFSTRQFSLLFRHTLCNS